MRKAGRFPVVRLGGSSPSPLLTPADRIVLYALVVAGLALLLVPASGDAPAGALIQGPGAFVAFVSLTEEATYTVAGPLGETIVEVRAGAVRVASSPCPHKTCVSMGWISEPGQTVVCVPNGVVVRVLGEGASRLDATTR